MITPQQAKSGRRVLGWSQRELASHVGVSSKSIRDFEKGHGCQW